MADVTCDILVIGGSLGGVAAALRAGATGASVFLIESSGWLGGQMTAQGVCTPDENQYIETTSSTASYRLFRQSVREYYRQNYHLSRRGAGQPNFNAGNCWVNEGFSVEPRLGMTLLQEMLASVPSVTVLLNTSMTSVEVAGDTIRSVSATASDGTQARFLATYVLDATDLGNLLPLVGVEYVIGAESQAQTSEPDAPDTAHPEWIQPLTFPFALERRPSGEDHRIPQPDSYAALKAQQNYSLLDGAINGIFTRSGLWTYRRFINAENFSDPAFPFDLSMINVGSNDFKGGSVPTGDPATDAQLFADARLASLGYLYWLQNECPRDGHPAQLGYPELMLRTDVFGTADGTSVLPYIRESRRILALKTIIETDITAMVNPGPRAALFADSCGIGDYPIDIHAGSTGEPGIALETKPFQIPVSALIPQRVSNLLAACKNIGTTHITNGAYRIHPTEWNIGESAGALAAFCIAQGVAPRDVTANPALLKAYQRQLLAAGIPLFWWSDVPLDHPAFTATQLLGIQQIFEGNGADLRFSPDDLLTPAARLALSERTGLTLPTHALTRAEAAIWLLDQQS